MRCLTVAEAVKMAGHDAVLYGAITGVDWLTEHVDAAGIEHISCDRDSLDPMNVKALGADRLVVDSYWIDPGLIGAANRATPTMAIIDNDVRGIEATWFVDQNLGAESRDWSTVSGRILAGSDYALVRRSILDHRIENGWDFSEREAHVVAFMGGTDPAHVMTDVAASIARVVPSIRFTAVTTAEQVSDVSAAVSAMPFARVMGPTSTLPDVLGTADVIVSAAGTSSWDVCSLGRPAVLVGVVENQSLGLAHALDREIALGVDATRHGAQMVGALLAQLLGDRELREAIVRRALATFDGRGAERVADALMSDP
jgi:spore coat polysaccharide biosynthesis predicted glycosyltransferase SpsG